MSKPRGRTKPVRTIAHNGMKLTLVQLSGGWVVSYQGEQVSDMLNHSGAVQAARKYADAYGPKSS